MKVLVTGGAGYLGSVLVPMLLQHGYDVTVLDNFMYNQTSLAACCSGHWARRLQIIRHDTRNAIQQSLLRDQDVVIALAALVGAPICDRDPATAWSVNCEAVVELCDRLDKNQLLIYPNTNSGYGIGGESLCTEESPLRPVSEYGKSKVVAEDAVLMYPYGVSLRLATLFGMSPRMRLDLMVNEFVYRAVKDKFLMLYEGGFRRNFLHVRDAASAMLFAIARPDIVVPGAYNAGLSSANVTKRQLCERIQIRIPEFTWSETTTRSDPDKRDYLVSNTKLEATGWKPLYSLEDGIEELQKGFQMPFQSYTNVP